MGVLSLSVVLLTLSALSLRTAYLLFTEYYDAVQRQVSSITRQAEPRSDLEFPAVTSGVLAPVNANLDAWSLDALSLRDGRRAKGLVQSAQRLMELAIDVRLSSDPKGKVDVEQAVHRIANAAGFQPTKEWIGSATSNVLAAAAESVVSVRLVQPDSLLPLRVRLQGPFGTEATSRLQPSWARTTLLIPSTFLLTDGLFDPHKSPNRTDIHARIREDILAPVEVSRLLEDALDLCLPAPADPKTGEVDASDIVQAYFISERSILRIWPAHDPNSLGVNRYWASAHYLQQFYSKALEGRDSYESPPYIDLGGNGIVRTICRVVSVPHDGRSGRLFAMVAVDYRLPTEKFLDELARRNMLFNLHQLILKPNAGQDHLNPQGEDTLLRAAPLNGRRVSPRAPRWEPTSRAEQVRLMGLVTDYASRVPPAEVQSRLGLLKEFPEPVFILPLAREADGSMRYLLLEPRTPRLPWDVYGYGLSGVVLLVVACGLLVWWNRHALGELERLRQATFIRNLQIGVLRVDAEGYIVEANQVCEWLLGITMEQHGERPTDDRGRRKFSDLIEEWIVPVERGRPNNLAAKPVRFIEYEATRRGALESSSYCAFSRRVRVESPPDQVGPMVLFVSGGPIIQQPPTREWGFPKTRSRGASGTVGHSESDPAFLVQTGGVLSRIDGVMAREARRLRQAPRSEEAE